MDRSNNKTAIVTGSSGFIGFHLSKKLLEQGWKVVGVDCLSDYYDVSLKLAREDLLRKHERFSVIHELIQKQDFMLDLFRQEAPEIVIHLAAQAGVRHSIENPRSYLETNINGTFEILEASKVYKPAHLLIASTSSAYGANNKMPYCELDKSDHQMSFYAATKKATESMAHSYAHVYGFPITMFRFFTVYGPWGRPDMALFKFTKAILDGVAIDVYNYGKMLRDFTYVDDLVNAIVLLSEAVPNHKDTSNLAIDSISPVAPFRLVNIGNSVSVNLMDFIQAIEHKLEKKAIKNLMPIQLGDVPETLADTSLLQNLTGFTPNTDVVDGVGEFVDWYLSYYGRKML